MNIRQRRTVYWYRIDGSKKYHCFGFQSRIYPSVLVGYFTACGKYVKVKDICSGLETSGLSTQKKCSRCCKEVEKILKNIMEAKNENLDRMR